MGYGSLLSSEGLVLWSEGCGGRLDDLVVACVWVCVWACVWGADT